MQNAVLQVTIKDELVGYIADLVEATRANNLIELGISPRGAIAVSHMAKACAIMSGRDYVTEDDKVNMADVVEDIKVEDKKETKKATKKVEKEVKEEKVEVKEEAKEEKKAVKKTTTKKETAKKETTKKETKKEEKVDLSKLTVAELKEMAKAKGVDGYTKLKKAELIDALK